MVDTKLATPITTESQLPTANTSMSDVHLRVGERLESWKEIAAYVRRDVKTARRWEQREGLPVHRHRHGISGSVYAFVHEIDAWRMERHRAAPAYTEPSIAHRCPRTLVGRSKELAVLHDAFSRAAAGQRQMMFVSGELGIGKTALLESLLSELAGQAVWARGHCTEQYGTAEPCLPFVEALTQLARHAEAKPIRVVIERAAPSWVARLLGRTGEAGLVRELCEAVEMVARLRPLVVVVEDLHWADPATVEVLARLGTRRHPVPLMVVGSFRRAPLLESKSALRRVHHELCAHFESGELALPPLDPCAIADYLAAYGEWTDIRRSAGWFSAASGGNPLYLAHLLRHAVSEGHVERKDGVHVLNPQVSEDTLPVPATLCALVETQLALLDEEPRRLLAVASVAGREFAAASLAAATAEAVQDVERTLQRLAWGGDFITRRTPVAAADGSVSGGYAFVHRLHREVLYHGLPPGTRAILHQRMAGYFAGG